MIQNQFINKLLQTQDTSLIIVNNLDVSFFSDYPEEFRFIKNHIDSYGNVPDRTTFLSKFSDFDIFEVNESNDYLIDELYEDRNKRKLASVFKKVRECLIQDKTEEAVKLYTIAVDDVVKATHLNSVDIFKDISRYNSYVERSKDFLKFYVKTGFPELDEIIGGWDKQEELATIVARTNQGKSWLLLKCAVAAAEQGLNVGIYSGEMSENKVGYRVDTLISHISNTSIVHGNSQIQNEYKQYLESLSSRFKGSIKVITPNMINGPAGVTALRAFIDKENLDMLCVDQHSLLEDDRHAKNPVEKAANISRDLKNLQVMKKIPIIAVSQQNRESTENGVSSAHVAQTDRIAQDSTILIFFEQKDGVLTLNLIKSRDSVNSKKIQYAVDFDKGIFSYIPQENDALKGNQCERLKEEFDELSTGEDVF